MRVEIAEAIWLDEHCEFSLAELAALSGLPEAELLQLMDYEALPPARAAADIRFGADCLAIARTACRLRDDFELDAGGLALALKLLERIHRLEAQLRALDVQLPRRYR